MANHTRLWIVLLACLLIGGIAASACGNGGGGASIAQARSDKPRITDPNVPDSDLAQLVAGNTTFALDLYHLLSQEDGNIFFSPYSISAALAMTYAGARGDTETEMADALDFTLPQDRLHPAFNALDQALAAQPTPSEGQTGNPLKLSIANALWAEQTYTFLPEFLDTLAENYGAGMNLVDFINAYEEARQTINAWVSDQTEGRIPELLPDGVLNDMTRLVLTNTIYFNGSWLFPFDPGETSDGTFRLLDGSDVTVPMMHREERSGYGEMDGAEVVPLRYEDFGYAMYAILPPEGQFEEFETSLDADRLDQLIHSVNDYRVDLTMPKFEFDSSFDLPDALKELGMNLAFEPYQADLSGMDGTRDLFIRDIIHKAFVSVDEQGTEATAATGVVAERESMPALAEVSLDRPFLFLIRNQETGAILFLGRVLDPTG